MIVKIDVIKELEKISDSIGWAWCKNKITDQTALNHLTDAKKRIDELIRFINLEDKIKL